MNFRVDASVRKATMATYANLTKRSVRNTLVKPPTLFVTHCRDQKMDDNSIAPVHRDILAITVKSTSMIVPQSPVKTVSRTFFVAFGYFFMPSVYFLFQLQGHFVKISLAAIDAFVQPVTLASGAKIVRWNALQTLVRRDLPVIERKMVTSSAHR